MQDLITRYYRILICTFSLISAFPSLADVSCVVQGDQVTCSWTGNPLPEGGGEVVWGGGNTSILNTNGQYSCANCVNMSPDECNFKKGSIIASCQTLQGNLNQVYVQLNVITGHVQNLYGFITKFQSVDPDSVKQIPILNRETGETPKDFAVRYKSYIVSEVNEWLSDNGLSEYYSFDYVPSFSAVQVVFGSAVENIHNIIVGGVAAGIQACQDLAFSMAPSLSGIDQAAYRMRNYLSAMGNNISSISNQADSITCDTCVLGSTSSGGGGGSGSEGGAADALLPIVTDIRNILLRIETANNTIIDRMNTLNNDIMRPVLFNLGAISNYLGRLDSYVFHSFSNDFYKIVLSAGSYSNVLNSIVGHTSSISNSTANINIKLDLFNTLVGNVFSTRLDSSTQGSTPSYDGTVSRYSFLTNRYLSDSVSSGRSTNWFERIEILLAALVFSDDGTNSNVASSYSEASRKYDSEFASVNTALSAGDTEVSQGLGYLDGSSRSFLSLLSAWHNSLSGASIPSTIKIISLEDSFGENFDFEFETSEIQYVCNGFRLVCRMIYIFSTLIVFIRLLVLMLVAFNKIRLWFFDAVQVFFNK